MSSRHRRSITLKRFDALYRNGRKQSATIGTSKPIPTASFEAGDILIGSRPSVPGTPEAPSNGPTPPVSIDPQPATFRLMEEVRPMLSAYLAERRVAQLEQHRARLEAEIRRQVQTNTTLWQTYLRGTI